MDTVILEPSACRLSKAAGFPDGYINVAVSRCAERSIRKKYLGQEPLGKRVRIKLPSGSRGGDRRHRSD